MAEPIELSPEVQQFADQKRIQGKKKLKQWLPLLEQLSEYDQMTDDMQAKAKGKATLFGVLILPAFFVLVIGAGMGGLVGGAIGACLILTFIVLAIVFAVRASKLGKDDLENDLRSTIAPMLRDLQEDIDPEGKLAIDMDLAVGTSNEYQTDKQRIPSIPHRRVTETTYQKRICGLSIPLLNGSLLTLDIDRTYLQYDHNYTSRSGKSKHKRKWKVLTTVAAGFTAAGDDISFDESAIQDLASETKVKQKQKAGNDVATLVRRFKDKSAGSAPETVIDPEAIIGMFVQLCTATKPSAQGAA